MLVVWFADFRRFFLPFLARWTLLRWLCFSKTLLLNIINLDLMAIFWGLTLGRIFFRRRYTANLIFFLNFERNTRLTHFLFHFISNVLWTYLHCYLKNDNNVNHCEFFYSWVELISSGSKPFIVVAEELIRYNFKAHFLTWVGLS